MPLFYLAGRYCNGDIPDRQNERRKVVPNSECFESDRIPYGLRNSFSSEHISQNACQLFLVCILTPACSR